MSTVLTDAALTDALSAAAESFPDPAPTHELLAQLEGDDLEEPWYRRRAVQLVSLAAAAVVALVLVQPDGAGVQTGRSDVQTTAGAPEQDLAEPSTNFAGDLKGADAGRSAQQPESAGAAPPALSGVTPPKGATPAKGTTAAQDSARVVKTGSISLVVDKGKVGAALIKVRAVATGVNGYVAQEQSQELGDDPTATITLRVPVASFDSVVAQLRSKEFGAKVISAQSSGKDVTAAYADQLAQLKSLQAARDRYLAILGGADTVGEVLSVQQRVDEVQRQIDQLEGSRRVLANQSDLATLTVTVAQKDNTVLKSTEPGGFSKAWDDAIDGFTSGVQWLIARSGKALLLVLLGVAAWFVGRLAWRRARRSAL